METSVRVWEESVEIPTYGVGKPDKNPMFLEKRVYQGSSGKVYPYPVIDKILDEKRPQTYHLVLLEHEYLHVPGFLVASSSTGRSIIAPTPSGRSSTRSGITPTAAKRCGSAKSIACMARK